MGDAVLLVDDNEDQHEICGPLLERAGYTVARAANRPLAGSVAAWLHKPVEPRAVVAAVEAILRAPGVAAAAG